VTGVEDDDCLTDATQWDDEALGSAIGVNFSVNASIPSGIVSAGMSVPESCGLETGGFTYLGRTCAVVALGGGHVSGFANANPPLVQWEAIVTCCEVP